jgi:hypothetical protein
MPDGSVRDPSALGKHIVARKPAGRHAAWDDEALLVVFLEVEIALAQKRASNPAAALIGRICEFLLKEGAFQPDNRRTQAETAETLRAKYYAARKWQLTLPQITRDRYARVIAKEAARRRSK